MTNKKVSDRRMVTSLLSDKDMQFVHTCAKEYGVTPNKMIALLVNEAMKKAEVK